MIPSSLLVQAAMNRLASDPATLQKAAASENHLVLVVSPFTPARGLDIGTLTLAAWTGSASKVVPDGAMNVAYDPLRGEWFIQIDSPAGGFLWECTAAPVAAVTCYGVLLTDTAEAVLYGSAPLSAPVIIEDVGDSVEATLVRFYERDLLAG